MEKNCARLDEASLGRVLQHIEGNKNVKTWGVLTAYRYLNTPKENRELNKRLEHELRSLNKGFFKVEGHWVECTDANLNYDECPKDKLKDSVEESLFVPNISAKEIHNLGKKYGQDAVIFGGEETKGNATLIYKDGKVETIGKFSPDKIQQAYSKLKGGRTFVFKQPTQEPKQDTKMTNLLPKDILGRTVRNPETGKDIKVGSALKYDKTHPAHKAALSLVQMMTKK
ncbi:MAG: hypothetical protein RLZZ196_2428 [Bacteroidota bacterium]|jgi:hypothetical protein